LLIGGFAVGYHGYPRATIDIDLLLSFKKENIGKVIEVLEQFGFGLPDIHEESFWDYSKILRMGNPPLRIELMFKASGIEFDECFDNKVVDIIDGIEVYIISLDDLKKNKLMAGRYKDLNDLENLP
jgi:hypothetical protein